MAPGGHLSSGAPIRAAQPGAHAVDVGVVAAQPVAVANDHVDRARRPRVVRQGVDQGGDLLLVRRLDQRAGELVVSQLRNDVGKQVRPLLPALDDQRQSGRRNGRLLHRLEGGLGGGLTDDG